MNPAAPWWLLSAAATGGAVLVGAGASPQLDWQPALWPAQPWRAVSAAWVHFSVLHLGANLVGAALVTALGTVAGCGGRAALAWALAWPLTHVGLLLQPALLHYGGLSGLMHAGVAVAVWQLLRSGPGRARRVGAALAVGVLAKLLLEAPWQGPLRQVPGWDIPLAPLAHATGALAGALCAWACGVGGDAARRPPGSV